MPKHCANELNGLILFSYVDIEIKGIAIGTPVSTEKLDE